MKKVLSAILLFFMLFSLLPFQANASVENPFSEFDVLWDEVASGHTKTLPQNTLDPAFTYIVSFKKTASVGEIFDCVKNMDYNLLAKSEMRLFAVEIRFLSDFYKQYSSIIDCVEENNQSRVSQDTNDKQYANQWALQAMNIDEAWDITTGSNVKVAVIDTGISRTHEDFAGVKIADGFDFVKNTAYVDIDTVGHGTMVSSVICAKRNNGVGMAGVNDAITLVPYRISDSEKIDVSDSAKAIIMAADAGCKVINMSYGGSIYTAAENAAIQYASGKGCIIIASAGNEANSIKMYPACYDNVISVGAINANTELAYFSSRNGVDVVAPGTSIVVADYSDDKNYLLVSGTSFSSPYVAAVASLALSVKADLTADEFEALLQVTSTDIGAAGYDKSSGWGIVNASLLLTHATGTIIAGVADGAVYHSKVTPLFSSNCRALLDGKAIKSKESITETGKHLLVVYDGFEVQSFYFIISAPVQEMTYNITGYKYYNYYTSAQINFSNGTAAVDSQPVQNGYQLTKSGFYTVEFTDSYGNSNLKLITVINSDEITSEDLTEPVELNNGRLGVYLNKKYKNAKWYFNETAEEIILFTGSDTDYIDNIYILDMNDFSLISKSTPPADTLLFDRTWAANGIIYTATDTEIKTCNPRTLAVLGVYTDMPGAGGFRNPKVVSVGNTAVLADTDAIWIADFTAKTVYSDQSDSGSTTEYQYTVVSGDGRYVYFTKRTQGNGFNICCYDTVSRKILYTILQNSSVMYGNIKNIYLYQDYLIVGNEAFNTADGSLAYQTADNIIGINHDLIVLKNGIYNTAGDILYENNSFSFFNCETLYISSSHEIFYIDKTNSPLVLVKTSSVEPVKSAVNNITDGGIYIGTATPVFNHCIVFSDGVKIESGVPVTTVGKHTLLLINPLGFSRTITFYVEEQNFRNLSFEVSSVTLNLGQSYTTVLNTCIPADELNWTSDNENISVKNGGVIVASKSGNTTLTAVTENGIYKAVMTITVTDKNVFDSPVIPETDITFDNGYVYGITDKTTVAELKEKLGDSVSADILGTGKTLTVNGLSYTIILKGDINGDGIIDAKDYLFVKKAYLKAITLSETQLKAAALEGTALPTATDYLKIKRHFLGTYNLFGYRPY